MGTLLALLAHLPEGVEVAVYEEVDDELDDLEEHGDGDAQVQGQRAADRRHHRPVVELQVTEGCKSSILPHLILIKL